MVKKVAANVLALLIFFSNISFTSFADTGFPDLGEGHWAYPYVMALVADGVVSGFEDGHFRPENTVSRAEFVKMIGKGPDRHKADFEDVSPDHWGYEYIMYSGLAGKGKRFLPGEAITRYDVLQLIWTRHGSPKGSAAPSIITSQGDNSDAVAWAYAHGVIQGNDGLNLRLDESLSRAEAATLIVRSRSISAQSRIDSFADIVSEEILKYFYYSTGLFGEEAYSPYRTVTNGEMARAALRLAAGESQLSYAGFSVKTPFEHKYAKDIYIMCDTLLGAEKITVEYADKKANIQDTLAALVYASIRQSKNPVSYGERNNYYHDALQPANSLFDTCLTYAYKNGVYLYTDGSLRPGNEITVREIVAIAMQLDYLINFGSEITSDRRNDKPVEKGVELRKTLNTFPQNYGDFQYILKGIPNEVYLAPFTDNVKGSVAKTSFGFAREYSFIFTDMIYEFKKLVEHNTNVNLRFSYFPSLVCENSNGGTVRVKCEVLENADGLSVKNIFKQRYEGDLDFVPAKGSVFYADIVTGQPIVDIFVSSSNVVMKQIVFIEK